jgi:hypothetical protein
MSYLPAIFSLLVAAAGWFYIMHAAGATNLQGYEASSDNRLRIRLRRVGGGLMIGLAVSFYVAYAIAERRPGVAVAAMAMVVVLLPAILFLAYVDLRLTRKMRERFKRREP